MRKSISLAAVVSAVVGLSVLSMGTSSATSTTKPVTITFWNTFTGPDQPGVIGLVKKFNQSQSAVKVAMTIMPYDVMSSKLLPAYQSKTGPVVAGLDPSVIPGFADKRVIQPIDDLYTSKQLDVTKLVPAQIAATTWKGKHYGAPMSSGSAMLYYNKKLLTAAGITDPSPTLEGLAKQAVQLTHYQAGADTTNQYGFVIADHAAVQTWAAFIWAWGGGIVSADGKSSEFGSAKTVAAVNFWNDLIQNSHISPVGLSGVDTDNLFQAGRAAFNLNGPWAASAYKAAGIDYGVVPLPVGPSGKQVSVAAGATLSVSSSATSNQRKAALAFITYWNSKLSQVYWSISTSYPPNRTDISLSDIAANPTAKFFAAKQNTRFFPGGTLLNFAAVSDNAFVPAIQQITNSKGDAQKILSAASDQINSALKSK